MPVNKNAYLRYQIIDELLAKKNYSRKELCEKLSDQLGNSISLATLDKDIRFLKDHFRAPIESLAGKYFYKGDFSLSNIKLTRKDERALEFAVGVLDGAGDSELVQEALTIINKIFRKSNTSKSDKKYISSDVSLNVIGLDWLSLLYDAILEKSCIIIEYNSPRQKKIVKHVFSPYLLKEYAGMWYVIGYSEEKGFTIVMALDRIKAIRRANVGYHIDPDFDPEKYFKYSFGITHRQYHKPEKVKFWVDKDAYYYMKVRPLHSTQRELEETEDGFIVQLEVYLSEELLITLMGLGCRVKVLSPPELVSEIKNHLLKMNPHYL